MTWTALCGYAFFTGCIAITLLFGLCHVQRIKVHAEDFVPTLAAAYGQGNQDFDEKRDEVIYDPISDGE